ncbi:ROK family protein [Emticicia sp. CRIBPO]|uniref:ROK family protein n=1 Tax=Emticicia sp. CRIBPO TaxID=2683258 RepID=UPI001412445C|nr:ROK family protein [Emticicia sp. CRIBPO]NBA88444.1 ROK family protein [Emticicia sp. CRIBPO]
MYIGVDIGGSHITVAEVDLTAGKPDLTQMIRAKIHPHGGAEEILSAWVKAIKRVAEGKQTYFLGIAMPGPFDYEKGICLMKGVNKYDHLYGMNIREELALRLDIPAKNILFLNDSAAFLAGEMVFGTGKSYQKGMGITLGTGLGTAIYENGTPKDMGLGIGYPLHDGVAEDFISTRWFIARYSELTGESVEGVKELADKFYDHPVVRRVFKEFSDNMILFLEGFIERFHPEIIVIGGNISLSSELFFPKVNEFLQTCSPEIRLEKSLLNENAALLGSAGQWKSTSLGLIKSNTR